MVCVLELLTLDDTKPPLAAFVSVPHADQVDPFVEYMYVTVFPVVDPALIVPLRLKVRLPPAFKTVLDAVIVALAAVELVF